MTEELLQAEPTGHSYFVSRLTTRQAHYLWDCSSPVHDDVKFYDNFLAGLEARGEYLNLAQLYLTLKSLYGESDEDAGEGKSTFSYQFLLAIHKEERAYPFLLHVFDYRGAPRFQFRKLARPVDKSAQGEVTRAELNDFIETYYQRLIRQFQAIKDQPHQFFFRRVKEPPILYGNRDGEYFEKSFASENELLTALAGLRPAQT
jgi:hypothetical protein